MTTFVFDAIDVFDASGTLLASIARPVGPLEDGFVDPDGVWQPSQEPTRIGAIGFGIDGSGQPYFDTEGPSPGEDAQLWVNGATGEIWIER